MSPRPPRPRLPESSYQEIVDAIVAEAERIPADVLRELVAKKQRRAS